MAEGKSFCPAASLPLGDRKGARVVKPLQIFDSEADAALALFGRSVSEQASIWWLSIGMSPNPRPIDYIKALCLLPSAFSSTNSGTEGISMIR
jgi:hypothetical protein